MEDAHTCVVSLGPMKWSFFAVFDGHAGKVAAEICSRELVDKIEQVLTDDVLKVSCFSTASLNSSLFIQGLTDSGEYNCEAVITQIKKSFLNMDQILRKELNTQGDRSGTTCTAILISPNHFFFINCGDSRSILVREDSVKFSTKVLIITYFSGLNVL